MIIIIIEMSVFKQLYLDNNKEETKVLVIIV